MVLSRDSTSSVMTRFPGGMERFTAGGGAIWMSSEIHVLEGENDVAKDVTHDCTNALVDGLQSG